MKTLIKTIEEFSLHVGVATGFSIEPIKGDILLVEDEQLRKYLGDAFYEALVEKYDTAPSSLTEQELKLISYLQAAVANLAMESYLILNQVTITDSGIHIHSDETTKTAFQWQINELKRSLLKKGYSALEKALQFLIRQVDHADFAAWKSSGIMALFRKNFINTAAEFSDEYSIRNSWLTFIGLLPIIRKVERTAIYPQLGEEFAQEIIEEIKAGTVSVDNRWLLQTYIRPALAHFAVAKALVEQGFELTPDGIEITYARVDDGNSKEADADNAKLLQAKVESAERDGHFYMARMRRFLDNYSSATKYATYFQSDRYTAPTVSASLNQATNRTYRAF